MSTYLDHDFCNSFSIELTNWKTNLFWPGEKKSIAAMIVLFFKSDVLGLDKFHVNARVKLNNIIYFSHPYSAQS